MRRSFASLRLGALALAAVVAFPVAAQFRKPEAAIAYLQEEMAKLNGLAKGGDIELIRGQVGLTEKACKTCHDAYTKE